METQGTELKVENKIQSEINLHAAEALPLEFDFYHLGAIRPAQDMDLTVEEEFPEESVGVAFSVFPMDESSTESSGFRTLLMAVFDPGLDAEIYMEAGNIIASRYAAKLSKILSENISITPPLFLKSAAVQRLSKMKRQTLSRKKYIHAYDGRSVPIEIWILKVEGNAIGHA